MEALAAFGAACNVLQVIDFSLTAIKLCKQFYEHGASIDNLDLERRSQLIAEISKDLLDAQTKLGPATTKKDSQLHCVVRDCLETTIDLQSELAKLKKGAADGVMAVFLKHFNTVCRRKAVEKIERKMEKYQDILHTGVLVHMSREQAAFILEQQETSGRLENTLRIFIQRFADDYTLISDLIRKEEDQTRTVILSSSKQVRDHLDGRLDSLRLDDASKVRRKRLLNSLKFPEMNTRRNNIEEVHPGTFMFALEDQSQHLNPWDSLPEFLRGNGKLYWIQGKPGSGKSTLMKLINEDERTRAALGRWRPEREVLRLSFFFWLASANSLQRSSKGLWCSLLYQLLSQDARLIDQLQDRECELDQKDSVGDWSSKELSRTFLTASELRSSPIFVLLDGLDEFDQQEGAVEIVKHIRTLSSVPELKLLVSSRPEFEIMRELKIAYPAMHQMKLQDLTRKDITRYVEDFLQEAATKSQLERLEKGQRRKIIDEVVCKADGVFIWVRYVLQSLIYGAKCCSTWKELQQHLSRCPNEILALYSEMLSRQNPNEEMYREEAAMYFYMAVHAPAGAWNHRTNHVAWSVFDFMLARNRHVLERILETEENVSLSELVKLCDDTKERFTARCAGLLETSSSPREKSVSDYEKIKSCVRSNHVTFIHRSAYDFIAKTPEGLQILDLYRPTLEESLFARVHSNMAILRILWWESGYDLEAIILDLSILSENTAPWLYRYAETDDVVVKSMQTMISSYARVISPNRKSKALDQWNFRLPDLTRRDRQFGHIYKDAMGLAASLGITAFIKSFVEQMGCGRKLRTDYASYLLLCAFVHPLAYTNFRPTNPNLVAWLLDQKADPNWRQHHKPRKTLFPNDFILITSMSSLFFHVTNCLDFGEPSHPFWALNVHQMIIAGADMGETVIWVLEPGRRLRSLLRYVAYPRNAEPDTAIFLELQLSSAVPILAHPDLSICPSGLAGGPHEDTRKVRFFATQGKFYQPDDIESGLTLAAYDGYVQKTEHLWAEIGLRYRQKYVSTVWRRTLKDLWNADVHQWNEHVKKTIDEVLPRCREMTEADMRTWFVENGWLAPEGSVSPLDIDNIFEDE